MDRTEKLTPGQGFACWRKMPEQAAAQVQRWRPFDSPVNYFPQTADDLEKRRRKGLERRLGQPAPSAERGSR